MEVTMPQSKLPMIESTSYDPNLHAITPLEYGGLQRAFAHLNATLFEGSLPDVLLTLQRKANSYGHFGADRFSERTGGDGRRHELNLNPDGFVGRTDKEIVSTLLHEQVHLWQFAFGANPPKRGNYHNKEWAAKMIALGLMPSSTGMPGGRITGTKMTHYILENGLFCQVFAKLQATGWKLNLESTKVMGKARAPVSKVKSTCPNCGGNAWAKPDYQLACIICGNTPMVPEQKLSVVIGSTI
jgi:hypothetical protein